MGCRFTSNLAVDLGRISYGRAYEIQKQLVEMVKEDCPFGFLLFLEHDPVYTIGRKPVPENYAAVDVVVTERGGDVTYHGPGQMVIYPVVRISNGEKIDVREYVKFVEDTVIGLLEKSGYSAFVGEEPGIWINTPDGERKVASIGMAIDHGISYHGISINLTNEAVQGFLKINPCGLDPSVMHYANVPVRNIKSAFIRAFSARYGQFLETDSETFMKQLSVFGRPWLKFPDLFLHGISPVGRQGHHEKNRGQPVDVCQYIIAHLQFVGTGHYYPLKPPADSSSNMQGCGLLGSTGYDKKPDGGHFLHVMINAFFQPFCVLRRKGPSLSMHVDVLTKCEYLKLDSGKIYLHVIPLQFGCCQS